MNVETLAIFVPAKTRITSPIRISAAWAAWLLVSPLASTALIKYSVSALRRAVKVFLPAVAKVSVSPAIPMTVPLRSYKTASATFGSETETAKALPLRDDDEEDVLEEPEEALIPWTYPQVYATTADPNIRNTVKRWQSMHAATWSRSA